MTQTTEAVDVDRALKAKHRALQALGNYEAVATEVIPALGPVAVEAAGVRRGSTVLDVAAGSGNAAIPAARTGATVVASDLTPELLEIGRPRAEAFADLGRRFDLGNGWMEAEYLLVTATRS